MISRPDEVMTTTTIGITPPGTKEKKEAITGQAVRSGSKLLGRCKDHRHLSNTFTVPTTLSLYRCWIRPEEKKGKNHARSVVIGLVKGRPFFSFFFSLCRVIQDGGDIICRGDSIESLEEQ